MECMGVASGCGYHEAGVAKNAGPARMRPAMHLYITYALYFEIYTTLLEVIKLMSIAGYEAYVCGYFFGYKTLCAAFIWLRWDGRSRRYVCLYCAEKKLYIKFNYKKYWNKNKKLFRK